MYLVYFDESGNSGTNYNDANQPVFSLSALLVPHASWPQLERELQSAIERFFPSPRWPGFEIHAGNLYSGRGEFRNIRMDRRLEFCDEWLQIAQTHGLKLISRAIQKRKFQAWLQGEFGAGVLINPHVVAFPLVALVVDDYLRSLPGSPLGIFIFDENKEIVHDIEKSIRVLRGVEGVLKLGQIIEKGFFIDFFEEPATAVERSLRLQRAQERGATRRIAGARDSRARHCKHRPVNPPWQREIPGRARLDCRPTIVPQMKGAARDECPESVKTGPCWSLTQSYGKIEQVQEQTFKPCRLTSTASETA